MMSIMMTNVCLWYSLSFVSLQTRAPDKALKLFFFFFLDLVGLRRGLGLWLHI